MSREGEILQKLISSKRLGEGVFAKEVHVGSSNIPTEKIKMIDTRTISQKSSYNMFSVGLKRIDAIFVKGTKIRDEYQQKIRYVDLSLYPLPDMKFTEMNDFLGKLKGENVWLLEVKVKANHSTVEQLIEYEELFKKDNPEVVIDGKGIICKQYNKKIEKPCKGSGIKIFKA